MRNVLSKIKTINAKIKNNEKGSITILVLSSLLVILIVLVNLYISGSGKVSSQAKEINKIQQEYSTSEEEMEEAYIKAANEIVTTQP